MKCIFLRAPLSAGSWHTEAEFQCLQLHHHRLGRMTGSSMAVCWASYLIGLSKGSGISCSSSHTDRRCRIPAWSVCLPLPCFFRKNSAKLPHTGQLEASEGYIRNHSWLTSIMAGHLVMLQCWLCHRLHITVVFDVLG